MFQGCEQREKREKEEKGEEVPASAHDLGFNHNPLPKDLDVLSQKIICPKQVEVLYSHQFEAKATKGNDCPVALVEVLGLFKVMQQDAY